MKQTIVSLLVFSLSCGSIFGAGGNFGGGNGSMSSPFLIEDAADLFAINRNLSAAYRLTTDIDLEGYNFNQAPIAPGTRGFKGYFDGDGHAVRNLAIIGTDYLGLFGYLYKSTVVNLGLQNVNVGGVKFVGALAGKARQGTVERCYSTGTVKGVHDVGGLIGYAMRDYSESWTGVTWHGPTRLLSCYSQADVSGNSYVGGMVGWMTTSEIRKCYSTGKVTGIGNESTQECFGGLIGFRYEGTVLHCYSTGTVSGKRLVGGFVGEYNFYDGGTQQTNSFWNTETSGRSIGCGNYYMPGLVGINNTLMAQQSTFAGWDFINDWQMDTGYYQRPLLRCLLEPEFHNITASAGANGSVSPSGDNWYKKGVPLFLTASPYSGYVVDGWYVGATLAQSGGLTYNVGPVLADMNISVTFKTAFDLCQVTITRGPEGGTSPNGVIHMIKGGLLAVAAYPDPGYEVDQWKLNGSVYQYGSNAFTLYGTQTNTNFVSIEVTFKPVMYTVHIQSGIPVGNGDLRIGNHGSTAPDGYQQVQQGGGLTIIAYPQNGYEVYAWQVNGVMCNHGEASYNLQNTSGNMTIGVLFKNSVFANGDGTVHDPYQVHDFATLSAVNDDPAAHYKMTNDIDLSGQPDYPDALIGVDPTAPFLGVFDGNNRKITGLSINSHNDYLGLFGCVSAANGLQGQVRNLTIEGAALRSGSSNVGILCGLNQSGLIEKCRVVAANVGGDQRVAGLCGYNTGIIRYSSAEGSVTGSYRVGLLTGNCYQGVISDCYAIGALAMEGEASSGGGISGDSNQASISNCYASCSIDGEGRNLGSFGGWSQNSSYDECVTNRQTYPVSIGGSGGGDVGSVAGLGRTQMQTMEYWAATDWDFLGNAADGTDDIWRMCRDGVDFPRLWWQSGPGDIACGDGVNLIDFATLGQNWETDRYEAGFYDNADINGDGIIGVDDLVIIAQHWLD